MVSDSVIYLVDAAKEIEREQEFNILSILTFGINTKYLKCLASFY